jgi:hypothetical protein
MTTKNTTTQTHLTRRSTPTLPPLRLEITGYRWFSSSLGNTYHVARATIIEEGEVIFSDLSEVTYGFGHSFVSTALSLIPEDLKERLPKSAFGFIDIKNSEVIDVKRKKDLPSR